MSVLTHFLELQKFDTEIYRIMREQERLPRKLSQQYQEVVDQKKLLIELQENVKKLRLKQSEAEGVLADIETKSVTKKSHLNVAKSNKEYKTLLSEIEDLKKQKQTTEESVYQIMETIEKKIEAQEEMKKSIDTMTEEYEYLRSDIEKDLGELSSEHSQILTKRQGKYDEIAQMQPGTLREYERILHNTKGRAIVAVEDECCSACRVEIRPNNMAGLIAQKMIYCEGCHCLLYLP